jgi:hypothetical protein
VPDPNITIRNFFIVSGAAAAAAPARDAPGVMRAPPTAAAMPMHQMISHIHLGNALLNRVPELKAFTVRLCERDALRG